MRNPSLEARQYERATAPCTIESVAASLQARHVELGNSTRSHTLCRMELIDRAKQLEEKVLAGRQLRVHDQLPLWDRSQRGMPNAFARSALYNVNKANAPREMFKNRPVATLAGVEIFYTGEELRQDDADVFLEICHLARETALGERVEFSGYSMLKVLGWGTSKKSYTRLRATIERLKAGTTKVRFDGNRRGFAGSLVRKFTWSDEDEAGDGTVGSNSRTRWVIYMEREIIALFSEDDYTRLAREQRQRLKFELSKWLHSYYHTHAQPFAHKVAFIHEKCGSNTKALFHFRPMLKRALEELVSVGFLISWEITKDDLVKVVRNNGRALKGAA